MKQLKRFFLFLAYALKIKSIPFNTLDEFKAELEANKQHDEVYKRQRHRKVGEINNKRLMLKALTGKW